MSLTPDMMPAWELREHLKQRDEQITTLRAEVERLREWNREIALNAREFVAENERLRVQNIQMQAALGYGIMAEDERHILPSNPYKCGTCDANKHIRAENEKLRAVLDKICNGPRDADLDYVDLFVEVKIEARAALEEKP